MSPDPSNYFNEHNIIVADRYYSQNRTHNIINQNPLNGLKRTVFCQLILDILQLYKITIARMIQNVHPLGVNMSY